MGPSGRKCCAVQCGVVALYFIRYPKASAVYFLLGLSWPLVSEGMNLYDEGIACIPNRGLLTYTVINGGLDAVNVTAMTFEPFFSSDESAGN